MKRIFFILLGVFIANFSFSQDASKNAEKEAIKMAVEAEKRGIIEASILLEEGQEEKFWELYDQYESERSELGEKRVRIINAYDDKNNKPTDAELKSLMTESFMLTMSIEVLRKKYFDKMVEIVDVDDVVHFFLVERYVDSKVNVYLLENRVK
jgi:hypothetical protein